MTLGGPFNHWLGLRIVERHEDGVTIACEIRPDLLNSNNVLHGGITATLADAAAGMGLIDHLQGRQPVTTTELKINYLKPITGAQVKARAKFVRIGKTLAVAQVEVTNDKGDLTAIALVTYMLLTPTLPA